MVFRRESLALSFAPLLVFLLRAVEEHRNIVQVHAVIHEQAWVGMNQLPAVRIELGSQVDSRSGWGKVEGLATSVFDDVARGRCAFSRAR